MQKVVVTKKVNHDSMWLKVALANNKNIFAKLHVSWCNVKISYNHTIMQKIADSLNSEFQKLWKADHDFGEILDIMEKNLAK